MKIGFSLGRCVRDIVKGEVNINDVLVIVSGTRFDTDELLASIVSEYMYRPGYLWGLEEDKCQAVALELWKSGKIHQPRNFGLYRGMMHEDYVWADLFPTSTEGNEAVKQAWQAYRFLLSMTEQLPENRQEHWNDSY